MSLAGIRATVRIARRDAVRAKGRSALIVAMIGIPMLGLAFADVAVRTGQLPPAELASREIGTADLVVELVSGGPIEQVGRYDYRSQGGRAEVPVPTDPPDIRTLLPAGSRVASRESFSDLPIGHGESVAVGDVARIDLTDPSANGLVRRRSGALPRTANETAVTAKLARDLDAGVGDTVTIAGTSFTVSGIVVDPTWLGVSRAYVQPGAALPDQPGGDRGRVWTWAVTLPAGVRDTDLVAPLNRNGFKVTPRTWYFDPPPDPYDNGVDATVETVGVTLVAVGLATLEIVLLAGTAFAVGARRKRRELGLLAATGGDRRDVRRVVLAGGVVLGSFAGVLGVAGGIAAVAWLAPLLSDLSGSLQGPLDIRPLELGAIVVVGAGTALLATLMPARAASRQPVVAALTGRRGDAPIRRRVPVVALGAVALGVALAFWAAGDGEPPGPDALGNTVPQGRQSVFALLLGGAVLAELGFVACAPALVAFAGRLASRLPLSLRLATRDAARHRTRSGPAVAAVVAAVAGSVALSVYVASDTERQRRAFRPSMPAGTVLLFADGPLGNALTEDEIAGVVAALPVRDRITTRMLGNDCRDAPCVAWLLEAVPRTRGKDGRIAVADPALATWIAGRDDPALVAAMEGGAVAVFDRRWLRDGAVVLRQLRFTRDERKTNPGPPVTVPAVLAEAPPYDNLPSAVMTPETARRLGLPTIPGSTLLTTTRLPTGREEALARGALPKTRFAGLEVARGFEPGDPIVLLVLAGAAAFVTLGSTGIATGLAAADSRPDLATLAAVGAAPGVRRRLAMAQAATLASLGSGLGVLAGLVPSVAIVAARADYPLALPWPVFALTMVGAPVLAALVAGLFTRARLPMQRRLA